MRRILLSIAVAAGLFGIGAVAMAREPAFPRSAASEAVSAAGAC